MSAAKVIWNRSAVYQAVRERHHYYMDVVDRLMREETKLRPTGGDQAREQIVQLAATIDQIETLGGNADATRTTRDALIHAREIHEPKLAKVQAKLNAARQCLKWCDLAHDGMHWLMFAEPAYDKETEPMLERITIRRCNGNKNAFAAVWNDRDDLVITTALSIGDLVERMRATRPEYDILIPSEVSQ